MKVVIFCGGQGMRMREASEVVPKPMIPIGTRPVLWHVMKYYAHFGFTDFVLCLGYRAEAIKQFFLNYSEALANDFVLSDGGARVHLLKTDIHDWNIAFVDTGLHSCIGDRLQIVRHLLRDDEFFLANYGDTLTDAHLPTMIERAKSANATASFLAVRPNYSFHVVSMDNAGKVNGIQDVTKSDVWINGGYFVMRSEILDQMRPGEDLVEEPFRRLMASNRLLAQRHEGFWAPMDTLKDKMSLEMLHERGRAPWELWAAAPAPVVPEPVVPEPVILEPVVPELLTPEPVAAERAPVVATAG
jgi:glucose-1-phosphate cytidylyltransferase